MDDYVYIPDDFDFSFLYDDDDPSWLDAIKAEIEQLEGFRVEHNELILKVWHYGTEAGACYHLGSHLDITPTLINELAKYGLDLERFMCDEGICYQLIKPRAIKYPKIKHGLNHIIAWSKEKGFEYSGLIDGHHFYYLRNSYHGDYIQIIHNNCPYCSFWNSIPKEIYSYFEAIWRDIRNSDRLPLEPSLGSKVASYLPLGFKAYGLGGGDNNQCRVERSKQKYCYIKRFWDCEYYVSPTENPQLMSKRTDSLHEAISEALKMIDSN
ncbi:MAG: hypothetical protein F6K17_02015 [Okeania sp. SIO3C4]|nr:hypothetical protein [Okeania sp. SIO3C4]